MAGTLFHDAYLPVFTDLLPNKAGLEVHQGADGYRAWTTDQVVCSSLSQWESTGKTGFCVIISIQVKYETRTTM